jgi:predicted N-formylglutamate amidohydrolase
LHHEPLLGAADPPVFRIVNAAGRSPVLLTADHAGRAIPRCLGDLGLSDQQLASHGAWDLGVDGLGLLLAARLDAFLILHNYSRLVIDANRPPRAPDSIVSHCEQGAIAANLHIEAAARERRLEELFHPYHRRIAAELEARRGQGRPSVLVTLHSFTPVLGAEVRPWHVGVLHGRDARLARRVRQELQRERHLRVGDNQPYAVSDASDHTLVVHGEGRRIPHVELEVRQDLLATEAGRQAWAQRLAGVIEAALAEGFPPLPDAPASVG